MSARREPSWAETRGPFKFLDYFTEDDEAGFAGRDSDVQTALAGVLKAPSFVLYGGSGTGKTSLLFAGLFPRLRQQGLRPVYTRTLVDPLADLRRAIRDELGEAPPESAGLTDLLAALSSQAPVVLVFDQFEEFFIRFRGKPELRDPFIAALGEIAADRRLAVKLLFSLRQEFLGELDDFRQQLPQLLDNEYRLKPLTAFGARQAIASQLRTSGVRFERRFLTRVVDLLEDFNFDPTILQIVCSEVYRQASAAGREAPRLSAADVDAVGDVRLLFQRYLNEMAAALPAEAQLTVRAVLATLIAGERSRRAATFETIHRESTRQEPAAVRSVLDALVLHRLVRRDEQGEESWYELTHERLAEVVHEWLELDERFRQLRTARKLIANLARGEQWRREPGLLLTGHQLDNVVGPVRRHLPLPPAAIEYLLRSAIFRRSRDSGIYWIGRYGAEPSRRLVLEMLAGEEPKSVWGAACMARHVEDPDGEVARACARKAAREEDLEIAAEAYYSVLGLTHGSEHKRLMRQAVDEVVTGAAGPNPLSSLYRRGRVRRLLKRTRKRVGWQAMSQPYRGLKTRVMDSIAATLLWGFLIGPAIYVVGAWPTGDPELASRDTLGQALGWGIPALLLIAIVVATWLPATIGRTLGRVRPSWPTIVLFSWAPARDLAWPILLLAALYGVSGELSLLGALLFGGVAVVVWLAVSIALVLATAVLVHWNRAAVRADAPEFEIWTWSLLTSCGLPALAPFVLLYGPAYLFALRGRLGPIELATPLTVAVAMALSFLCFVFQLLLARSGLAPSRQTITAPRRRRARAVTLAAVALNLLLFCSGGYDTVPFLGPRQEVGEGPIHFSGVLGPGYPDVDYLRLVARRPLLLEVAETSELPVRLTGLEEIQPGQVLALPGPPEAAGGMRAAILGFLRQIRFARPREPRTVHQLVVGPSTSFGKSESFSVGSIRESWTLSLEVLGGPVEPAADWSYALVPLERDEEGLHFCDDARRRPALLGHLGAPTGPFSLARSLGQADAVEVVVPRNQPTAAASAFSGKIEVLSSQPEEDPQNCNFVAGPVLVSDKASRRTWRVPADRWPDAEIELCLPDRDPGSAVLVVGVRLPAQ